MSRAVPLAALALAAVLVTALTPAATAHGAPEPKDPPVSRLLEDWTDDCYGDSGAGSAPGNCKGSEDLIALDLQEMYDASLGNVVVFRLYADKGTSASEPHKDVVSLNAGGAKTLTFATTDDSHFTSGGGFDRVGNAVPLGDGTRFYVEGTVKADTLGGVGTLLSGFHVDAYAGSNVGDFMTGGCHNTVGDCQDPTGSASQDAYTRQSYTLAGPVQYASLDAPASVSAEMGVEHFEQLTLTNLLGDNQAQVVSLSVSGADGIQARFHQPDQGANGYTDAPQTTLPAKASTVLHLALTGQREDAAGTLTLTLTTDLGGRLVKQVPYTVGGAASGSSSSSDCMAGMDMPGCPSSPPSTTTKSSPAPMVGIPLLAIALAAIRRRGGV